MNRIGRTAVSVGLSVGLIVAGSASAQAASVTRTTRLAGCSQKIGGDSRGTTVINVSCSSVRAYAFSYTGGGTGTNIYSAWSSTQADANGSNITSHGAQVRLGTTTSEWLYF